MNSHLPWLKQEHDEEDFDESYTTENQLVYDNKSIRHLNQGLTIQQYQQIQALAHVHPDLHPHHLSSPNPLDYRTGYSQAHSQAPYHLNESYPAGQSLDGYSHYPENQAHFDEFADIIPYSNHVMSTPNATPDGSPSMSRVRLMNGMEGIPTERDFNLLVTEYIGSLSVKKQDKALIPSRRYYSIKQVLSDPKCTTIESAQFRFWAKKMFTLDQTRNRNVCHEDKPVAVREDLYAILSNSHHQCGHGGRDKTSGQVRTQWSWVPKELIARYVKICPTCQLRRYPTTNEGTGSPVRQQMPMTMAPGYIQPELTPPGYIAPDTMNVAQAYTTATYEQQYLGSVSGADVMDGVQNPPYPNGQSYVYAFQQTPR